jgi:hypothetical protein
MFTCVLLIVPPPNPSALCLQRRADGYRQQWSSGHFVPKIEGEDGSFKTAVDESALCRATEIMKVDDDDGEPETKGN